MAEMNQVKRYFGARFGYGEPLQDGVYAVPTQTSKGKAFMRMEVVGGEPSGNENFILFWDEELTVSWYKSPKPESFTESEFAKAFRKLDGVRP